jgi:hypothetical protein
MDASFYCQDCETPLEADEIDTHESQGHDVRGALRPKRLLSQDPWERIDADGRGDVETVSGSGGDTDVSGDSG